MDLDLQPLAVYVDAESRRLRLSDSPMSGRYWHLKHNEILASLSSEDLLRLERRSLARSLAAGTTIYLPSDLADGVLLLAEGRVRIGSAGPDGKRATLSYVEPGEIFGELSLLGGGVRDELAEAVERSLLILIPREELLRVMEMNPRLTLAITKLVGVRRQRIERRLRSLLFRSVSQRLADLLSELSERYGRPTAVGVLIDLRLSHQEMASAIGSTRESVTLTLGQWTAAGIVEKRRNRVVIRDQQRLSRELGDDAEQAAISPPALSNLNR